MTALLGRKAFVLGVETPVGRRAAVALAEAGADVAVATLSEDTQAEFAANSTANEFWAMGRKGVVLTTDGRETAVKEAIADATAELGPVSIYVHCAPHALDADALTPLRSDPAVVVVVQDASVAAQLLGWTRDLASGGLRANAVAADEAVADDGAPLRRHASPAPMDAGSAVVYLCSDETAAIEGALIVAA